LAFGSSPSPQIADGKLTDVLARIEELLSELRRRDINLVQRIENEVDSEERLDPFWSAKIEQLALLGVI
jgi:hypothetical protein